MKRSVLIISLLAIVIAGAVAQTGGTRESFSTVAVFDLDRVITSFFQDSRLVRDYNEAERQFRADLQRAEQTLRDYQSRRADALDRNDAVTAQRLRADIAALEEDIATLRERFIIQQERLQSQLAGDEFFARLYDAVSFVAQDRGYTIVLEERQLGAALFWYSPTVDVTDLVIRELVRRSN